MKSLLSLAASIALLAACGNKTTSKNSDTNSVQGRDTVLAAQLKAKKILDEKYGSSYLLGSVVLVKINAISANFPQNWLIPTGKLCMAEGTIRISDFEEQPQLVVVSNITLSGHDKNVATRCGKNANSGGNFSVVSNAKQVRLLAGSFAKVFGVPATVGIDLSEKNYEIEWNGRMEPSIKRYDVYGFFSDDSKEVTDLCSGKYERKCDVSLRTDGVVVIRKL